MPQYKRRTFGVWTVGAIAAGISYQHGSNAQSPLVRQDVSTASVGALKKVSEAIGEMMAISRKAPGDPRGWLAHADAHREFCSQPANGPTQIHYSWWFLPWHRAYLAVTERKLREIAKDSSLVIPYWNWSSDRRLPKVFASGPLASAVRFTPDLPLQDDQVGYFPANEELRKLQVASLAATQFTGPADLPLPQFVATAARSFGGSQRPNNYNIYRGGTLEGSPHGDVHVYVGGEAEDGRSGDMAAFETAARDPLFFAHHGNLDRIWERWRSNPSNRGTEPTSKAFLEHSFPFRWLDGSIVEVRVSDTLDTRALGYTYDTLEVARFATPASPLAANADHPAVLSADVRVPAQPLAVGGPKRVMLVIRGLQSPRRPLSAAVRMASRQVPSRQVTVGSVNVVRSGGNFDMPQVLSFDVTSAIQQLGTAKVTVSIVPHRLGDSQRRYSTLRAQSIAFETAP